MGSVAMSTTGSCSNTDIVLCHRQYRPQARIVLHCAQGRRGKHWEGAGLKATLENCDILFGGGGIAMPVALVHHAEVCPEPPSGHHGSPLLSPALALRADQPTPISSDPSSATLALRDDERKLKGRLPMYDGNLLIAFGHIIAGPSTPSSATITLALRGRAATIAADRLLWHCAGEPCGSLELRASASGGHLWGDPLAFDKYL